MGQKIHPIGFRIGNVVPWQSRWFGNGKNYREYLLSDILIRKLLMTKLRPAGILKVEIERSGNKTKIIIFVARPGVLIGRGGVGLTELKKYLLKELRIKNENNLEIAPMDIKAPDLCAYLVGVNISEQLAKRMPAQRVMNQAVDRVMKAGAKGVKVFLAGRIGGAEIARKEWKALGTMPLHTLRQDIDFASVPALTKSGYVGVKVWINRGEAVV
ncbi:MAG: 30S ribosomal protein S3 [Candidatus Daviesbacteria bacterium]|nr:30S ribosomal protein S3 [Candidatus Daviesbacteria bacterium]